MVGPYGSPTGAVDTSRAVGCYSDASSLFERGLHTSGVTPQRLLGSVWRHLGVIGSSTSAAELYIYSGAAGEWQAAC
jgi:hypothetical protein